MKLNSILARLVLLLANTTKAPCNWFKSSSTGVADTYSTGLFTVCLPYLSVFVGIFSHLQNSLRNKS